jgi:glucokinase
MYLGIEIGGTKLQMGLGEDDGRLASLWRGRVDPARGSQGIREQIEAGLPELLDRAGVSSSGLRGVGVGFGGPVDDDTRTVVKSHQIEGWDGFPLADWISDIVGVPSALGNDADVAGLAEARHGAGKGLSPVFYVTIGSGIGGGLIIGGQIHRGCGRGAAEIGHLRVMVPDERNWSWPAPSAEGEWRSDILEHAASGWGLERRARASVRAHPEDAKRVVELAGGDPERITVSLLGQAVREGDHFSQSILNHLIAYVAVGISRVVALLCPRCVVIGGGVALLGEELFFEPLRRELREDTLHFPFREPLFAPFADLFDVAPASLGEEVVVHGAIALVSGER